MPLPTKSRRDFLKTTSLIGAGAASPYFFSAAKTLADETQSKNDRPTIAVIGAGGMGGANIDRGAKHYSDLVAVADVDQKRARGFSEKHSGGIAKVYKDYRDILERKDVDLIHIATPDHWHTKPLIEAMLAGKDVYCEKPLTLTIDEGKLIRKVQQETGRIVQVGTQQRSTFNRFLLAIAIVAEGRIGKIKHIEAAIGGAPTSSALPAVKPPKELDWDRWLGPAPYAEYRYQKGKGRRHQGNCHYEFRWWYEYSGGKLTDWGAHHVDIGVWALQANGQSAAPVSIGGTADHPVEFVDGVPQQTDRYNTATKFKLTTKFAEGATMDIVNGPGNGLLIEGDKGRLFVNRGKITGAPVEALKENPLPKDALDRAYRNLPHEHNERRAHWVNFFRCVQSRQAPISDVHTHMEALNVCHLAGIAARLGREIKWDDEAGIIVGDDVANSMLARPYRKGYEIEV